MGLSVMGPICQETVSADMDKWARAQPATALVDRGRVYFRACAPWLADFEDELLSFPNAAHDDQVDALAYACAALPRLSPGRAVSAWLF